MTISLRDYQRDAINALTMAAANGARRLLLQAATAAGKTVIAAQIVSHAASNGKFVLFLAHRRELVKQCLDKLRRFGVEAGTIMAGEFWDKSHRVQVASIQSLHSWAIRRKVVSLPSADLVVCDEAHHSNSSKTWREIIDNFPKAIILGMTATPINRRGRGLGHFFDHMVQCPTIRELTDMGFLVPATYKVPSLIDLKNLRTIAGDYSEKQLEARTDVPKIIGDIVENWARHAADRQTICFTPGVKSSLHVRERFAEIGVKAAHIDGFTPVDDRDRILAEYGRGEIQIITNCGVFLEGTDLPTTSCIIFARPTKSLLLYIQALGRGLRISPGKKDCMVLDHTGAVYDFGPVDQDWPWKLDYGEGDVRQEQRKGHPIKRGITCMECKEVYFQRLDCPRCGFKPQLQGKSFETYPAYLEALDDAERPREDRKSWYLQFLGYARARNLKDGFAYYKFIEKFPGEKPPFAWKNNEPLEPGLEALAYIKSRAIAWAKSRRTVAYGMPA